MESSENSQKNLVKKTWKKALSLGQGYVFLLVFTSFLALLPSFSSAASTFYLRGWASEYNSTVNPINFPVPQSFQNTGDTPVGATSTWVPYIFTSTSDITDLGGPYLLGFNYNTSFASGSYYHTMMFISDPLQACTISTSDQFAFNLYHFQNANMGMTTYVYGYIWHNNGNNGVRGWDVIGTAAAPWSTGVTDSSASGGITITATYTYSGGNLTVTAYDRLVLELDEKCGTAGANKQQYFVVGTSLPNNNTLSEANGVLNVQPYIYGSLTCSAYTSMVVNTTANKYYGPTNIVYGYQGDIIAIYGADFGQKQGAPISSVFTFPGAVATTGCNNYSGIPNVDTRVTATIPANAQGLGNITVTAFGLNTNGVPFYVQPHLVLNIGQNAGYDGYPCNITENVNGGLLIGGTPQMSVMTGANAPTFTGPTSPSTNTTFVLNGVQTNSGCRTCSAVVGSTFPVIWTNNNDSTKWQDYATVTGTATIIAPPCYSGGVVITVNSVAGNTQIGQGATGVPINFYDPNGTFGAHGTGATCFLDSTAFPSQVLNWANAQSITITVDVSNAANPTYYTLTITGRTDAAPWGGQGYVDQYFPTYPSSNQTLQVVPYSATITNITAGNFLGQNNDIATTVANYPVIITGSGFGNVQGTVSWSGTNCNSASYVSWSDTQIQVLVTTAGAVSGTRTAQVHSGTNGGVSTAQGALFVAPLPTLSNAVPCSPVNMGLQAFALNGQNLRDITIYPGGANPHFGDTTASGTGFNGSVSIVSNGTNIVQSIVSWSDSQITVLVDMSLGGVAANNPTVTVLPNYGGTSAGMSNAAFLKFFAPPNLTSVTPNPAFIGVGNGLGYTSISVKFTGGAGNYNALAAGTIDYGGYDNDFTITSLTAYNNSSVTWVPTFQKGAGDSDVGSGISVYLTEPNSTPTWQSVGAYYQFITIVAGPTITNVQPMDIGVGAQNQTITITGSGSTFGTGGTVNNLSITAGVGAIAVNSITSWATNSIVAVISCNAVASGPATVWVNNPQTGGYKSDGANYLDIDAAPTISSVSPSTLGAGASTTLTINGTGFNGTVNNPSSSTNATVAFGNAGVTGTVLLTTSTTITMSVQVASTATAGNCSITITNNDNQGKAVISSPNPLTVANAPSVTSVQTSFSTSSLGAGCSNQGMTLYGSNFGNSTPSVSFNDGVNDAVGSTGNSTFIPLTMDLSGGGVVTGPCTITVINSDNYGVTKVATLFSVLAPPTFVSETPTGLTLGAPVGQGAQLTITLGGTNFGSNQTGGYVKFTDTNISVTGYTGGWSSSAIGMNLTLSANGGTTFPTTGPQNFTLYTGTSQGYAQAVFYGRITITAHPSIASISPSTIGVGATNVSVTITSDASDFGTSGNLSFGNNINIIGSAVWHGGSSPQYIVANLDCTYATTGNPSITIQNGSDLGINTDNSGKLTISSAPVVSTVSPSTLGQGAHTSLTIQGSGFGNTQGTLSFGSGVSVTGYTSWVSGTIVCTVSVASNATTGPYSITVKRSTDNGVSTSSNALTIINGPNSYNSTIMTVNGKTNVSPPTIGQGATNATINLFDPNGFFGTAQGSVLVDSATGNQNVTSYYINSGGWSANSITLTANISSSATTGYYALTMTAAGSSGYGVGAFNGFKIAPAPSFISITNTANLTYLGQGAYQQQLTIYGGSFGTNQGSVTFSGGNITVTNYSWSTSQIIVTVNVASNAATASSPNRTLTIVNGDNGGQVTTGNVFYVVNAPNALSSTVMTPSSLGQGASNLTVNLFDPNAKFGSNTGTLLLDSATGNANISSYTVQNWSANSITLQATAATNAVAGYYTVTITAATANGAGIGYFNSFWVVSGPSYTSISQAYLGQGATNAVVTISGGGFGSSGTVTVSGTGVSVTSYNSWNNSSISMNVTVANNATTSISANRTLTIVNRTNGGVVTTGNVFYVVPSPNASGSTVMTPAVLGQGASGITVNLYDVNGNFGSNTGTLLLDAASGNTNINPYTLQTWDAHSITLTATVISNATVGYYAVTMTAAAANGSGVGAFNGFQVAAKPTFVSITNTANLNYLGQGATNQQMTIYGSNFGVKTGSVTFSGGGDVTDTVYSWAPSQIVLTVNAASTATTSGSANRTLTIINGDNNGQLTTGNVFYVVPRPNGGSHAVITPSSVGQGASNVTVNLYDTDGYFGSTIGSLLLDYASSNANITSYSIQNWSAYSITLSATVSASAATGYYTVTITAATANGAGIGYFNQFQVASAPTYSGISQAFLGQGATNAVITLSGGGFGSSGTVTISGSGVSVTSYNSWNSSSISMNVSVASNATTSISANRTLNIINGTTGGQVTTGNVFYVVPGPNTSGTTVMTPLSLGQGASGVTVNLYDINGYFGSNTGTLLLDSPGNTNITSYSIQNWSANSITLQASVAGGAVAGYYAVTITAAAANGSGMGAYNGFQVAAKPTFVSITNTANLNYLGQGATNQQLTIYGSNFGVKTGSVTFSGGGDVTDTVYSWGPNQIVLNVNVASTATTSGSANRSLTIINGDNNGQLTTGSVFYVVPRPNGGSHTVITPSSVGQGASGQIINIFDPDGYFGNGVGSLAIDTATGNANINSYPIQAWDAHSITISATVSNGANTGYYSVTITAAASGGAGVGVFNQLRVSSLPTFNTIKNINGDPLLGQGAASATLTIDGGNFGNSQGSVIFSGGGIVITNYSWSNTTIVLTVNVASNATTGGSPNRTLTILNGDNGGQLTTPNEFYVIPRPNAGSHTVVTPGNIGQGASGATINLFDPDGYFGNNAGTVLLDAASGNTNFTSYLVSRWSANSITLTASVASAAVQGYYAVTLTANANNGSGIGSVNLLHVVGAPTFTSINGGATAYLGQGATGATINIVGTNFGSGGSVIISGGGITITNTVWSGTLITLTVNVDPAANTAGSPNRTITIINNDNLGQLTTSPIFYIVPKPNGGSHTVMTPSSVGQGASNSIINLFDPDGYFGANTGSVQLDTASGNANITSYSIQNWSANSITLSATVSNSAGTGYYTVTITAATASGAGVGYFNSFQVVNGPSYSSLSQSYLGQGATNATLTISGGGLGSSGTVTFSGTGLSVTGYPTWSNSSIVMTVSVATNAATSGSPNRILTITNGGNKGQLTTSNVFYVVPGPNSSGTTVMTPSSLGQGASGVTVNLYDINGYFGSNTGTLLLDAATGNANITSYSIQNWSANSITLQATVAGSAVAGYYAVTITAAAANGSGMGAYNGFQVAAKPTFVSITNTANLNYLGQGATNQQLTIYGSNFGVKTGTVIFSGGGDVTDTVYSWGPNQIVLNVNVASTATTSGSANRSLTIINGDNNGQLTTGSVFYVVPRPNAGSHAVITPLSVGQGASGEIINIFDPDGYFGAATGSLVIDTATGNANINSYPIQAWDAHSITISATVSNAAVTGYYAVTITAASASGAGVGTFNQLQVVGLPTFNTVKNVNGDPLLGQGATAATLTIQGGNFGNSQGSVIFSGGGIVITNYSWSSTTIVLTVNVATGATTGSSPNRTLTIINGDNGGQLTTPNEFYVIPRPNAGSHTVVTPANIGQGASGATINLFDPDGYFGSNTGTVLLDAASGNTNFTSYLVSRWSANSITLTSSVSSTAVLGYYALTITASPNNGSGVGYFNLLHVVGAPTFTSINGGATAYLGQGATGATVNIVGTNFGSAGSVTFSGGGITITNTVWSSTLITLTVNVDPSANTAGSPNRTLTIFCSDNDGQLTTSPIFYIVPKPNANNHTIMIPAAVGQGASGATINLFDPDGYFGANIGSLLLDAGSGNSNVTSYNIKAWDAHSITLTANISGSAVVGYYAVTITAATSSGQGIGVFNQFQIAVPPTYDNSSPSYLGQGATGATLTINGSYFGVHQGTVSISGGGITITNYNWGSGQIVLTVSVDPAASTSAVANRTFTITNGDNGGQVTTGNVFYVVPKPNANNHTVMTAGSIGQGATATLNLFDPDGYFGSSMGSLLLDSATGNSNITAYNPTTWDAHSITMTATVSSSAVPGYYSVTITAATSSGQGIGAFSKFQIVSAPTFVSITNSANLNYLGQGATQQQLTIYGSNFGTNQGTVSFSGGGITVTNYNWSPSLIVLTVNVDPAAATASSPNRFLTITNGDNGGKLVTGSAFYVVPKPNAGSHGVMTPVSLGEGATNATVNIFDPDGYFGVQTGSLLLDQATGNANIWPYTIQAWDAHSITLTATVSNSAATGYYSVTITAAAGSGSGIGAYSQFQIALPPTYSGIDHAFLGQGATGATLTISGGNFGTHQGSVTISGGGVTITNYAWSPNSIVLTVNVDPAAATSGTPNRTLIIVNGDNNGQITTAAVFYVVPKPNSTGSTVITPGTLGINCSNITLNLFDPAGYFGSSTGSVVINDPNVTLGSITAWSANSITLTATVGASATVGYHTLTVTAGTASGSGVGGVSGKFQVAPAPVFSTINGGATAYLGQGATGATVTVAGSNFGSNQGAVTFSGTGVTVVNYSWSNTLITMTVNVASNAATAGSANRTLTIVNGDNSGQTTTSPVFYVVPKPNANSHTVVNPTGLGQGANNVVINLFDPDGYFGATTGSIITDDPDITLGLPTAWSANSITLTASVSSGAAYGYFTLTVTAATGSGSGVGTIYNGIQVNHPPTFTSINPANVGQGAQGVTLVINGNYFSNTQGTVTFSAAGISVTGYTKWTSNEIDCTVNISPTTTQGSCNISITNGQDGGKSTFNNQFIVDFKPSLNSASPTSLGQGSQGQVVTIGGNYFGSTGTITFSNNINVTGVTWGTSSIQATLDCSSATTGPVTVTIINGVDYGRNSSSTIFTINPGPTFTSVTPNNLGEGASNQTLTIVGTNFSNTQGTVVFSGVGISVTGYTSWGTNQIVLTANIASNATQGTCNITVTNGLDSGTATFANQFTVNGKPSVTACTPSSRGIGATAQSVTITGSNFGTSTGTINFSNNVGVTTINSWSSNSILVTLDCSAATAGSATISVTNATDHGTGTSSGMFTVNPAPSFSNMNPNVLGQGALNKTITLNGGNFGGSQGVVTFSAAGVSVTGYSSWNATQIVLTVNIGSATPTGLGNITVYNNTDAGKATFNNVFSVASAPTFTSCSPSSRGQGSSGQTVTIVGTNFGVATGSINFSNGVVVSSVNGWGTSSISVTLDCSGATAGPATVTVINGDNFGQATSASGFFTVNPNATFTSITPNNRGQGANNQTLIISGTNFGSVQGTVSFSTAGINVTGYTAWSSTAITLTANISSSAATGISNLTVTNGSDNGSATFTGVFTVNPAPSATLITPSSRGQGSSAQSLTITGSNFGNITGTVSFGSAGLSVASYGTWTNTSIQININVASGATVGSSTVNIVKGSDAGQATFSGLFTVNAAPTFSDTNPSSRGIGSSGQSVIIDGNNFGNSQGAVFFSNGIVVSSITNWSNSAITVNLNLTSATAGPATVTVVNGDNAGQATSVSGLFTVNAAPSFTSILPSSRGQGATNQTLDLLGNNFGATQGSGSVSFTNPGINVGGYSLWSNGEIKVTVSLASTAALGLTSIQVVNGQDAGQATFSNDFTGQSQTQLHPGPAGQSGRGMLGPVCDHHGK